MESEKLLAWHGLKKSVQTVDENGSHAVFLNGLTHHVNELAWGDFGRIQMFDAHAAVAHKRLKIHAQSPGPSQQSVYGFFKNKCDRTFSTLGCGGQPAHGKRRLAATCRSY